MALNGVYYFQTYTETIAIPIGPAISTCISPPPPPPPPPPVPPVGFPPVGFPPVGFPPPPPSQPPGQAAHE